MFRSVPSSILSPRSLWLILACWLGFRLWFAAALPMTGDEAYFVLWGRFPDWGFYDHPPMVGWWMSALLRVSDHPLWLRLPAVLLPLALALAVVRALGFLGREKALLAGLLVLLAPANVWNVLITTDTPLIFFGVLSALAFIHAFRGQRLALYALCGVLFAGAVLSKYFAALLGIAYAVATLLAPTRKRFAGLFLVGFLMLPALALMLGWNAENCWPNILFNLVQRNAHAGFVWQHPAVYVLMMAYMLGFLPAWQALRHPGWLNPWTGDAEDRLFWALAWVPLLLFALLSLSKQIGLHWVLTFVPLVLLAFVRQLTVEEGRRAVRWLAGLGVLHGLVVAGLFLLPLDRWQDHEQYPGLIWTVKTPELVQASGVLAADRIWLTDGYTYSAELSYARDRLTGRDTVFGEPHIGVFGPGSHYARQDDRLTDFRALDGQRLGILLRYAPDMREYAPYFDTLRVETFTLAGATFYRVLGDGFRYAAYRDGVLTLVRERFYRFPGWLKDCGCFFGPRYFPE